MSQGTISCTTLGLDSEGNEIIVLNTKNETNKLGDAGGLELISLMKENICLLANSKFPKPEITVGRGFWVTGSDVVNLCCIESHPVKHVCCH